MAMAQGSIQAFSEKASGQNVQETAQPTSSSATQTPLQVKEKTGIEVRRKKCIQASQGGQLGHEATHVKSKTGMHGAVSTSRAAHLSEVFFEPRNQDILQLSRWHKSSRQARFEDDRRGLEKETIAGRGSIPMITRGKTS